MQYRLKPVSAIQWKGGIENVAEMHEFLAAGKQYTHTPIDPFKPLPIATLHGSMVVQIGDFIVRNHAGDYEAMKPHVFNACFEPV